MIGLHQSDTTALRLVNWNANGVRAIADTTVLHTTMKNDETQEQPAGNCFRISKRHNKQVTNQSPWTGAFTYGRRRGGKGKLKLA